MGGGPAIPPGMSPLTPPARAIAQLTDPAFLGVLFHSVFWTLLAFAGVAVALSYLSGYGLTWLGWHEGGWLAPLLGTAVSSISSGMEIAASSGRESHRPAIAVLNT